MIIAFSILFSIFGVFGLILIMSAVWHSVQKGFDEPAAALLVIGFIFVIMFLVVPVYGESVTVKHKHYSTPVNITFVSLDDKVKIVSTDPMVMKHPDDFTLINIKAWSVPKIEMTNTYKIVQDVK